MNANTMNVKQRQMQDRARAALRHLLAGIVVGVAVLGTAGVMSSAAQTPVATQEMAPGVTLEILKLHRINSQIVQLDFALANAGTTDADLRALGIVVMYSRGSDMGAAGLALLDYENGRRHEVGHAGKVCLCSYVPRPYAVPAGDRVEFWAQYGAPAGVATVAVQAGGAPPIFDVPVIE